MVNIPNSNTKAQVSIRSLAYKNEAVVFFPYDFDIDDQYKPEWGTYEGFGRMDPIMTYKRTTRDVNLSFNVVAENTATAITNFQQLEKLIKFLYPVYDASLIENLYKSNLSNLQQSSAKQAQSMDNISNEIKAKNESIGDLSKALAAAIAGQTGTFGGIEVGGENDVGLLTEVIEEEQAKQGVLAEQYKAVAAEQGKTQRAITEANQTLNEIPSSGFGILNKSPLVQISFMNLLQEGHFVAAITNFKHKMKFDAADTSFSANGKVIPGEFSINIGFKVLHTYTPGTKNNYTF